MIAAAPASAQQAGEPADARAVLTVDMDRVFAESRLGADVQRQLDALRSAARAEFESRREALRLEESRLTTQRGSLPDAEFSAQADAFSSRVAALQRDTRDASARMQAASVAARRRFNATAGPVLAEIMAERGASMVIGAASALVAAPGVDVTDEVIRRLDAGDWSIDVAVPMEQLP